MSLSQMFDKMIVDGITERMKRDKEYKKNIITIEIHRDDIQAELGYEFTDERWDEFKDYHEDHINDNNCYAEDLTTEYFIEPPESSFRYGEIGTEYKYFEPEEYWTNDNCEKEWEQDCRREWLIEETEKLFALKIEKYYLDAKYNPRTPIGEKFANALYDENFNG